LTADSGRSGRVKQGRATEFFSLKVNAAPTLRKQVADRLRSAVAVGELAPASGWWSGCCARRSASRAPRCARPCASWRTKGS
jgi:hypothetical protein